MSFDFDSEDERDGLFDLNKSPTNEESFDNEDVQFPWENNPNDTDSGIFPFVSLEPAKRRSKHRAAGTLEWKASTSVKRENVKAFLINKVIPVIHERWPKEDQGKTIFIQQDNARTHINCADKDFEEAASKNGFDIRLMCQPPNSPDLNILDLGFFSAIQALQHKTCPKTVEDLVRAVEESFVEYPSKKKATLERDGLLPIQIGCDASLVQNVMEMLALAN